MTVNKTNKNKRETFPQLETFFSLDFTVFFALSSPPVGGDHRSNNRRQIVVPGRVDFRSRRRPHRRRWRHRFFCDFPLSLRRCRRSSSASSPIHRSLRAEGRRDSRSREIVGKRQQQRRRSGILRTEAAREAAGSARSRGTRRKKSRAKGEKLNRSK